LHILGVVVFIVVLAKAPKAHGGAPLVEFFNGGGWASDGLSTMIGTVGPTAALIGFDCSVHMGMFLMINASLTRTAEEAKDSSRTVPVTLLIGYTTNVLLGFFVLVTW
jgi:choline transport protein